MVPNIHGPNPFHLPSMGWPRNTPYNKAFLLLVSPISNIMRIRGIDSWTQTDCPLRAQRGYTEGAAETPVLIPRFSKQIRQSISLRIRFACFIYPSNKIVANHNGILGITTYLPIKHGYTAYRGNFTQWDLNPDMITFNFRSPSSFKKWLPPQNKPPPNLLLSITIITFSHSPYKLHPTQPPFSPITPLILCLPSPAHLNRHPIEDILATMWNSLSLTENEAVTLSISDNKLFAPKNALVGKLAMKKYVSIFEVDKGLKSMWGVVNTMETTSLGDNIFLFAFSDESTCERIFDKQPWNFQEAIILLERLHGDEIPTNFALLAVPFWVQFHGLQLRAMNRSVGEAVGALLGKVVDVFCDAEGTVIGHCIRIWVLLDIHKPLLRWTNINIGGSSRKVTFWYEKLVAFCYMCARLDHLERNCTQTHSDGLRYYSSWLRANGQNPSFLEEVAGELNLINARNSPHHPLSPQGLRLTGFSTPLHPPYPWLRSPKLSIAILHPFPLRVSWTTLPHLKAPMLDRCAITPFTSFPKPAWDLLIPKQKLMMEEGDGSKAAPNPAWA